MAVAGTILAALAFSIPALLPHDGEPVAIVSWSAGSPDVAEAVAGAGGAMLGVVGAHVTIARPGSKAFVELLRHAGFWFALDASHVRSCLTPSPPVRLT
ncbi:MAG: hypothetical protein U1E62_10575 [Alsobacter sp.]